MPLASRSLLQLVTGHQSSLKTLQAAISSSILQPTCSIVGQTADARLYSTEVTKQRTTIYAACVLERLPIIKSPPPEREAEYKAWTQVRKATLGLTKEYPSMDKKQKVREDVEQAPAAAAAPTTTKADKAGVTSTMKRRLADKLVLLIKARQPPAAAAAAAGGPGQPAWTFPYTAHKAGETIRDTAERALQEAIGPSQVYFIGNAPMAYIDIGGSTASSSSSTEQPSPAAAASPAAADAQIVDGSSSSSSKTSARKQKQRPNGRVFFHLATVVNDPWDVALSDAVALEHAWVSKDELAQYIKDERLLSLAHRML